MSSSSQNSQSIPKPDLNAWLLSALGDYLALVNCVSHGTVQSFEPTTQKAVVAINYLRVIKNANPNLPNPSPDDQTTDVFLNYPLLVNVPVVFLGGGGGVLTFPVTKGDICLLLFSDREIDTWLSSGQITAPQKIRTHDLSDAWAIVGLRNFLNPIANFNTVVASLTDASGERLMTTGDMKPSLKTANHSGWLLMNGQTIGNIGSGADNAGPQYEALFNFLGGTGWGSGGTTTVDDIRGYTVAGYLASDPNFGTLRAKIGESTHLLTGPESGVQKHAHEIITNDDTPGGVPQLIKENSSAAITGSQNTETTGDTNAVDPHNNIQQTYIANWFIKI